MLVQDRDLKRREKELAKDKDMLEKVSADNSRRDAEFMKQTNEVRTPLLSYDAVQLLLSASASATRADLLAVRSDLSRQHLLDCHLAKQLINLLTGCALLYTICDAAGGIPRPADQGSGGAADSHKGA